MYLDYVFSATHYSYENAILIQTRNLLLSFLKQNKNVVAALFRTKATNGDFR